jgi:hypothetical protein
MALKLAPFGFQIVHAVLEELGARHVEAQINILAGAVAGLVDGFQNGGDRRFVRRQVRREAALIAHRGVEPLPCSTFFSV